MGVCHSSSSLVSPINNEGLTKAEEEELDKNKTRTKDRTEAVVSKYDDSSQYPAVKSNNYLIQGSLASTALDYEPTQRLSTKATGEGLRRDFGSIVDTTNTATRTTGTMNTERRNKKIDTVIGLASENSNLSRHSKSNLLSSVQGYNIGFGTGSVIFSTSQEAGGSIFRKNGILQIRGSLNIPGQEGLLQFGREKLNAIKDSEDEGPESFDPIAQSLLDQLVTDAHVELVTAKPIAAEKDILALTPANSTFFHQLQFNSQRTSLILMPARKEVARKGSNSIVRCAEDEETGALNSTVLSNEDSNQSSTDLLAHRLTSLPSVGSVGSLLLTSPLQEDIQSFQRTVSASFNHKSHIKIDLNALNGSVDVVSPSGTQLSSPSATLSDPHHHRRDSYSANLSADFNSFTVANNLNNISLTGPAPSRRLERNDSSNNQPNNHINLVNPTSGFISQPFHFNFDRVSRALPASHNNNLDLNNSLLPPPIVSDQEKSVFSLTNLLNHPNYTTIITTLPNTSSIISTSTISSSAAPIPNNPGIAARRNSLRSKRIHKDRSKLRYLLFSDAESSALLSAELGLYTPLPSPAMDPRTNLHWLIQTNHNPNFLTFPFFSSGPSN
jgi:hypothetical protein